MLPSHEQLSNIPSNDTQMDFDDLSLYLSAMWDEKSVYSKIETGFVFKPHMKDVYVEAFNIQTFNQDGNESANSKVKCYNPPDLIFKQLPVEEKVKKKQKLIGSEMDISLIR